MSRTMKLHEQVVAEFQRDPKRSQTEVAEAVGCSAATVSRALRARGVKFARGRGARPYEVPDDLIAPAQPSFIDEGLSFPDYQYPEDVDWREWLDNFSKQQDMHKRIDPRQDIITIRVTGAENISVVSTSDLHLGGGFTNHRAMRSTFDYILDTPNQYVWIVGDSIEGFIPGVGAGKMAETVEQQPATLRAQISAWQSLVNDLVRAKKLLFVTWGDHDGKWFEQSIGFNVMKPMIDRKVPYFNARGLVKLVVGSQEYFVLVNHGERFSSQYSHTHPQRRAYDQYFPADVVVGGHKHHPEWRVMWHYMQLQDAGLPIGGKTILVANGTFKTGPDSYSCRYWEHGIMGVPTLTFSGDKKDIDIFENPLKATQFLVGKEVRP